MFIVTNSYVRLDADEEDDGTDDEAVIDNLVNHIRQLEGHLPFAFVDDPLPPSTPALLDNAPPPPQGGEPQEPRSSVPPQDWNVPEIPPVTVELHNPRQRCECDLTMTLS